MSKNPEDLILEFAEQCRRKISEFDETEVRCGLIGPSGSGKSSLINAIAGKKISPVGVVEMTSEPQDFVHQGIIFTDLPGCGTVKWPKDSYIERLKLRTYDCFLLVTANRFTDTDVFLFHELSKLGKPCFVIRNKFDIAVEDGKYDNSHSEEETREIITSDILENLQSRLGKIYLVSARKPEKYDLYDLLDDVSAELDGLKQQRFVADMGAYSQEAIKKKGKVARNRILFYSVLAAANGINPIPGVDIAVDMSLLLKFGNEIANIYGLTSSQFEYIQRLLGAKVIPGLLAKVAQFSTKYLAKEGLVLLLKKNFTRAAAKQSAKWVPVVGPIAAASIGGTATFLLCKQMVDEAEQLAEEILNELIQKSKDRNND
jgi:GTP-binding protein EngB required for normal cell division/uncharacterized protein (DUF697 family)